MATSITALCLSFLILAATHGCCGDDQVTTYNGETEMVTAMKEVSQALQCFGDTRQEGLHTMKESLRLQKENSEVMLQIKEEMRKQNNENSCKRENETLNKLDICTHEITNLKQLLDNKDKNVDQLNKQITLLMEQLMKSNQTVGALNEELLEVRTVFADKNKTTGWTRRCEQHQHVEKIKKVVETFINNRDWTTLKRDISAVLDHSSEEYKQLQKVWSVANAGYSNSTQLVSLLLCAGLPADSSDASHNDPVLIGAANGGHPHLVKLMLDRGASVNIKDSANNTPLIWAAKGRGNLEVVQYLVKAGADTTAKNTEGYTALYYAKKKHYSAVEQYLEQLPQ